MNQKNIFVRQIKAGDQVSDSFLVTEKNMTYSQKGAPYLSLKLRDRTGEIEGRVWDRATEFESALPKGRYHPHPVPGGELQKQPAAFHSQSEKNRGDGREPVRFHSGLKDRTRKKCSRR